MVVAGVANSRTSKIEINKQQRILCAELSSSGFLQQQHKLLKLNQNNSNKNKKRHHPTSKCDVKNTPQFIETLIENSDKKLSENIITGRSETLILPRACYTYNE